MSNAHLLLQGVEIVTEEEPDDIPPDDEQEEAEENVFGDQNGKTQGIVLGTGNIGHQKAHPKKKLGQYIVYPTDEQAEEHRRKGDKVFLKFQESSIGGSPKFYTCDVKGVLVQEEMLKKYAHCSDLSPVEHALVAEYYEYRQSLLEKWKIECKVYIYRCAIFLLWFPIKGNSEIKSRAEAKERIVAKFKARYKQLEDQDYKSLESNLFNFWSSRRRVVYELRGWSQERHLAMEKIQNTPEWEPSELRKSMAREARFTSSFSREDLEYYLKKRKDEDYVVNAKKVLETGKLNGKRVKGEPLAAMAFVCGLDRVTFVEEFPRHAKHIVKVFW